MPPKTYAERLLDLLASGDATFSNIHSASRKGKSIIFSKGFSQFLQANSNLRVDTSALEYLPEDAFLQMINMRLSETLTHRVKYKIYPERLHNLI